MANGNSGDRAGVDIKEVLAIVAFGAVGGALSWVYAKTVGQPLPMDSLWALPASVLLGTGAAFIGVYVIANSDTAALLRCLGFALLCGFSWKPVYDAGSALISQQAKVSQVQQLSQETAKALQELKTASLTSATPEQLAPKIKTAAALALETLDAGKGTSDTRTVAEVIKTTNDAVTMLQSLHSTGKVPDELAAKVVDLTHQVDSFSFR